MTSIGTPNNFDKSNNSSSSIHNNNSISSSSSSSDENKTSSITGETTTTRIPIPIITNKTDENSENNKQQLPGTIGTTTSVTTSLKNDLDPSPNNNTSSTTATNHNTEEIQPAVTETTDSSRSLANYRRRHQRRIEQQDPIIAPGFGTYQDIKRLAQQLSATSDENNSNNNEQQQQQQLDCNSHCITPEVVLAIMSARGRGISRRSRATQDTDENNDDTTNPSNNNGTTNSSSAWMNFMNEAGVGVDAAPTTTTQPGTVPDDSTTATPGTRNSERKRASTTQQPEESNATTKKKEKVSEKAIPDDNNDVEVEDELEEHYGVLVQTGTLDSTIVGRNKVKIEQPPNYNLLVPTVLLPSSIQIKSVHTSCNSCHCIAISTNGDVYGWGRNEGGQLSSTLPDEVVIPTILTDLPKHSTVIMASMGKSHTLFLYADGSVYGTGYNKLGQCGVKANMEYITSYRKCIFQDENNETIEANIKQISCGEDFSVAVSHEGHLYSAGASEFGKLGNGSTGEHIITSGKTGFANCSFFARRNTFCHAPNEKLYTSGGNSKEKVVPLPDSNDILIDQVACGKHHAIAIEKISRMGDDDHDDDGTGRPRVFSWGCGSYGCLGHGVQADEYYPRLIGSLMNTMKMVAAQRKQKEQYQSSTAKKPSATVGVTLAAGALCSLIGLPNGHVYYWGRHRSIGEATMRPNLIDALANNGHVVKYIGAGNQTVMLATTNAVTVAWGQGAHGELGLGATKSSAKPNFIPTLDGCRIAGLACGYGSTIFIVRNDDEEDKKAVKKLPELKNEDCQTLIDAAKKKKSKREKTSK